MTNSPLFVLAAVAFDANEPPRNAWTQFFAPLACSLFNYGRSRCRDRPVAIDPLVDRSLRDVGKVG